MAFLITKKLDFKGITLDKLYFRLLYSMNLQSNIVRVSIAAYFSKDKFIENPDKNVLDSNMFSFKPVYNIPYNISTDGYDILGFIHSKLKDIFINGQTEKIYKYYQQDILKIDEKGDIMLDANNNIIYEHLKGDILLDGLGEEVYTSNTLHTPFCLENEVAIIDL